MFKNKFLSRFVFEPGLLPFSDREIISFDKDLTKFEQFFLNPEVEKNLISKNELLASFAISKAENSKLTLAEAKDIYKLNKIIKVGTKLSQKDHDRLEFFNIAKTFKKLNQDKFSITHLTPDFVKKIHKSLTFGLDIFANHLSNFDIYKSGFWRDNDLVRIGSYTPSPYKEIEPGVTELIKFVKDDLTPTKIALFHTALYALHPFCNGNKRVCRVLEHLLLRGIGLNSKNLYNSSYYYHKQKDRYYKNLLYSLERKNFNHFVAFVQEAIVLSIVSVVKTGLEVKRDNFIKRGTQGKYVRAILKPLVKRKSLSFKKLHKMTRRKMARQTFVNNLQKAVDLGLVVKQVSGRNSYYSLNFNCREEKTLSGWLGVAKSKLDYIPDDIKLT